MNPTQINLLGDGYFLFSLKDADEEYERVRVRGENTVHLLPSLTADFAVRSYSKNGMKKSYDPAAAVAAAAFLIEKRGLPLDEIAFDTPCGILKISYTDNGMFAFTTDKCKVLFTESTEIFGTQIEYSDVLVGCVVRAVKTKCIKTADAKMLLPLLSVGRYMPSALIFCSVCGEKLEVLPYTDYNPIAPTLPQLYSAGAFLWSAVAERCFSSVGDDICVCCSESLATVKVKCEIK